MRPHTIKLLFAKSAFALGLTLLFPMSTDGNPTGIGRGEIRILNDLTPVRRPPGKKYSVGQSDTLIGSPRHHRIEKGETLLDIARKYDLGINELQDLYPNLDPWIPPEGMNLLIPSQWILPGIPWNGILINVAELRLFYFTKARMVETFPMGIGDWDRTTPLGGFTIGGKRAKPTWFIPPALQPKYGVKTIPPGPDNPLGDYWLGLRYSNYGIHGTDIPWSVGRMVTGGCIRLYPEDMERLFQRVRPGTPVKIIYEPVKFGFLSGRLYVEVHKDVYARAGDLVNYGLKRLRAMGLAGKADLDILLQTLVLQNGMPTDITFDKAFP